MNFCDAIVERARQQPRHSALVDGDQAWTYAELVTATTRWAGALRALGLQPGDRVGICLRDSADFVLAMLGAAWSGITWVPLDWRAPAAEKARLAAHFDIHMVLTEAGSHRLPDCRSVAMDAEWQRRLAVAGAVTEPVDAADLPLMLKLSSGTTGTPKGAITRHQSMRGRLERNLEIYGKLEGYRYLSVLPLCFSGGNNYVMFHLMCGNTVILYPTLFSAPELVETVRRHRIDFLFAVPTVLRWLLDLAAPDTPLLPELRVLVTGTAPITAAEKRAVIRRLSPYFYEVYSTSTAGQIAFLRPADMALHAESVGRVNPRIELDIVDDSAREVPTGNPGILRCRGPGACEGYYGDPDQTEFSEKLVDGWWYTGDLGYLDADGFLHLAGRVDELIIRGGINVQPGVIEAALRAHPGVAEAAVKARASEKLGQEPVAYVVTSDDTRVADLHAWCRTQLAPHELPAEIRQVGAMPKTAAGKIRKRELPD